jgi:glycine betaine/choline ABC-type transport system substrate-binding protein
MTSRPPAAAVVVLAALTLSACSGSGSSNSTPGAGAAPTTTTATTTTTTATTATTLPGTGKPQVTIGDNNDTEQFVLGELYYEALKAQGFNVLIDQNIGPDGIRLQQLKSGGKNGGIDMYPEYLNVWNTVFAGDTRHFKRWREAYEEGQTFASLHGLELLNPTPFSDTAGIAVTVGYAEQNDLSTIATLARVAATLTLGGPPQFQSDQTAGLPAMEQAYGFSPASYKTLEIGGPQYQALDQDTVQAAYVDTTDGEFTTGDYRLLSDPKDVFGIGRVVPVVTLKALAEEGPAFAETINKVSALLTMPVIRELNAEVDPYLAGKSAAGVASRFLGDHGLIPASSVSPS